MAHRLAHYIEPADFAFAIDNLFVGEHRPQLRTPVHRNFRHVGQPSLKQFQEDPLRPAIIVGVDRADLTLPVVGQTDTFHLAFERCDVLRRRHRGVNPRLHRILFGGEPECVPSHRMQHIEAPHTLIAGHDIRRGIAFKMTDVETRS